MKSRARAEARGQKAEGAERETIGRELQERVPRPLQGLQPAYGVGAQ